MATWYCKAGFGHAVGADCEHIVKIPGAVSKARPPLVMPFLDDYYTEEAIAARREENKRKYGPTRRPFIRNQISAAVNTGDV